MEIRIIALLCAVAVLLAGCGGSVTEETVASATEPVVTTEATEVTEEPTTAPTEPKTFFEEQGFVYWDGFEVYETWDEDGNDAGILGMAEIEDATECLLIMDVGGQGSIEYQLANTKMDVWLQEYSLVDFNDVCSQRNFGASNIKNVANSLFDAFAKHESGLTKAAWLEKYQDYKIIHYQGIRVIQISELMHKTYQELSNGQNTPWSANFQFLGEGTVLLNSYDGMVFDHNNSEHPEVTDVFSVVTKDDEFEIAFISDWSFSEIDGGWDIDIQMVENLFVMVPAEWDELVFVLPMVEERRSGNVFEEEYAALEDDNHSVVTICTYDEYIETKDYMKFFFLSPNHY